MTHRAPYQIVVDNGLDTARERGVYVEGDETLVRLDVNRFLNSTRDAGRPSDAARSVIRAYLSDPVRFRRQWHESRER